MHERPSPPWIPRDYVLLCFGWCSTAPHSFNIRTAFLSPLPQNNFPQVDHENSKSPGQSWVCWVKKKYGGKATESSQWFSFTLSSFTNDGPCIFLPRISQKKEYNVRFHTLADSLNSPFPEHPLSCKWSGSMSDCVVSYLLRSNWRKLWSQRPRIFYWLQISLSFFFL